MIADFLDDIIDKYKDNRRYGKMADRLSWLWVCACDLYHGINISHCDSCNTYNPKMRN